VGEDDARLLSDLRTALSLLRRGVLLPREILRADAGLMGICSLMIQIFGLTLHINNPLKHNVISWRFRARLAIPYNVAARRFAL
jgi:hypothetical protein